MPRRAPGAEVDPEFTIALDGLVVIQQTKDGRRIVKKWPRPHGPVTSPLQQRAVDDWSQVAKWAKDPWWSDRINAGELSVGTTKTWRDLYTLACFGKVWTMYMRDGTVIRGARKVTQEIQSALDTITDEVGSIIVRTNAGWLGLQPGAVNEVLTFAGTGLPQWLPPQGGGSGAVPWLSSAAAASNVTSTAAAAKGNIFGPSIDAQILALQFLVSEVEGATYKAQLWTQGEGYTLGELIDESDEQTADLTQANMRVFNLPTKPIMTAGTNYIFMHVRTDASGTTSSGLYNADNDIYDLPNRAVYTYVRVASVNPQPGDTLTHGSQPYHYGLRWLPAA